MGANVDISYVIQCPYNLQSTLRETVHVIPSSFFYESLSKNLYKIHSFTFFCYFASLFVFIYFISEKNEKKNGLSNFIIVVFMIIIFPVSIKNHQVLTTMYTQQIYIRNKYIH